MGFFKNKTFNLIYALTAFQAFAHHGGEAFAFVYLLKAGISVPIVLMCIGLMFASRIMLRKLVLPVALKFGLRNALVLGILLEAATYPMLSQITGVGPLLVAYLLLWALSSSFYWTTYHAYVALIGDTEHRGKQVSGLEFVGTIIGIVAPLAGGLMLTYAGPVLAFSVVGLVMACAALPLMLGPNLQIAPQATIPAEAKRLAWLAMLSDGIRAGTFHFTWLIALFITLNESFAAFGGTLALAGIVGAIMGLFAGKKIDLGHGKRALQFGLIALGAAALLRAFGYGAVWSAVLANAAAAIAWPAYATAFNSKLYDLSRQSSCPLRYHVVAEGGWDLGTAISCLLAAALTGFGVSFFWPLLCALSGCVLAYLVLAKTYDRSATD